MSIIAKALKKAQEERLNRSKDPKLAAAIPEPLPSPETASLRAKKTIPLERIVMPAAIAVSALLVCVILFAAFRLFVLSRPRKTVPVSAVTSPGAPGKAVSSKQVTAPPVTVRPSQSESKQDTSVSDDRDISPLVPPSDLPELNGIMYSPTSPMVILNGRVTGKGDTVNGFTVLKIFPDTVTLSRDNMEYELKLR